MNEKLDPHLEAAAASCACDVTLILELVDGQPEIEQIATLSACLAILVGRSADTADRRMEHLDIVTQALRKNVEAYEKGYQIAVKAQAQ
jgi:hypothetical protein